MDDPLASEHWSVEPDEGTRDTQLGFAKLGEWCLVTREATYRETHYEYGEKTFELLSADSPSPLSSAPRALRIDALTMFPKLARLLKEEADAALKVIQAAKKFVNAPAPEAKADARSNPLTMSLEDLALPARTIRPCDSWRRRLLLPSASIPAVFFSLWQTHYRSRL